MGRSQNQGLTLALRPPLQLPFTLNSCFRYVSHYINEDTKRETQINRESLHLFKMKLSFFLSLLSVLPYLLICSKKRKRKIKFKERNCLPE